jgi:hypothetical protein
MELTENRHLPTFDFLFVIQAGSVEDDLCVVFGIQRPCMKAHLYSTSLREYKCHLTILTEIEKFFCKITETNSVPLVCKRTIPTERPPLVDEILVPTLVDRGVSRGQRGGSPTVVNLSFLGQSRYFSFR